MITETYKRGGWPQTKVGLAHQEESYIFTHGQWKATLTRWKFVGNPDWGRWQAHFCPAVGILYQTDIRILAELSTALFEKLKALDADS